MDDVLLGSEVVKAPSRQFKVTGWLGNEGGALTRPALRFEAANDKSVVWSVPLTVDRARADVVQSTGQSAFANTGFLVELNAASLPAGQYHLYLVEGDGAAMRACDNGRHIELGS
ncbi:hypothetical protein [Cognatilysobacter terrigena]|uniref:hypothetical protein n=1 Tax=Cognatilysobacter terrigena TaxID=2488749 RepID=UPI0010618E2A|nr:hypothetical protein [Lysobacter terrigena]